MYRQLVNSVKETMALTIHNYKEKLEVEVS